MRRAILWALTKFGDMLSDYTGEEYYNETNVQELLDDLNAQIQNDLQPLPIKDKQTLWIIAEDGLREIFAIARAEPSDDIALLTVEANTNWQLNQDDMDDDYDPEED